MQGSSTQRDLGSFAPFRADEMVETRFNDKGTTKYSYYPTLGGRLRVAREKYPSLQISTKIVVGELRQKAVVTCKARAPMGTGPVGEPLSFTSGSGIGTADKEGDGPRMLDSLIELAEARAISRALRALGIGVEFTGAEEMQRTGILVEMAPATSTVSAAQMPTNSVTHQAPPAAAVPPGKARRDQLGAKLYRQCGSNTDRYRSVLGSIMPGRISVNDLAELEMDIVELVVERAVECESPAVVAATKTALQNLIGAKTPVESWRAEHVLAARQKMRANGGVVPAPGHSAHGEHEPKF